MDNSAGQDFNKFSIPLTWGIVTGIASILLFTVYSMFLMESMGFMGASVFGILSFVVVMLILLLMATQQRKAMGGYITFKEAFQAIFIAILIVVAMSTIYSYIYTNWIDPEYFERTKEMSIRMAGSFGGDEVAEKAAEQAEAQIDKQNSFSGRALGFAISVVLYSLFGFIIAAIVKRNKPEHLA